MEFLGGVWDYVVPFLVILTVLVFVHEMGHYLVARRNGVRVEVFSIGFGREIFGWTDSAGTRWKFSLIPLGGYVKMFGDSNVTGAGAGATAGMTPEEREVSFLHKRLGQRSAIVFAGPLANYVFAIIVLTGLFAFYGQPFTPAVVGTVQPESAAAEAGIKPGDRIVGIDGSRIERFEDVRQIVAMSPEVTMTIVVERNGAEVSLRATPRRTVLTDNFGNEHEIGLLGVTRRGVEFVRHDPLTAVWRSVKETMSITSATFKAIGQMFAGTRATKELGGPLRIAQMSGQMAQGGFYTFLWFMGVLSLHLCLINLFPVPMLDGGHLLFYGIEAIRGKPLGEQAQEYGFRIGLALVLTLMLFVTWNDLVHLKVVDFIIELVT